MGRGKSLLAVPVPSSQQHLWHPSVTRLVTSAMESVAANRLIGVLLTGMGDDGAAAMTELRRKGGRTIAQDEATSIVFGMPSELIGSAVLMSSSHRMPSRASLRLGYLPQPSQAGAAFMALVKATNRPASAQARVGAAFPSNSGGPCRAAAIERARAASTGRSRPGSDHRGHSDPVRASGARACGQRAQRDHDFAYSEPLVRRSSKA